MSSYDDLWDEAASELDDRFYQLLYSPESTIIDYEQLLSSADDLLSPYTRARCITRIISLAFDQGDTSKGMSFVNLILTIKSLSVGMVEELVEELLRTIESVSDDEIANVLLQSLLDFASPSPNVPTSIIYRARGWFKWPCFQFGVSSIDIRQ